MKEKSSKSSQAKKEDVNYKENHLDTGMNGEDSSSMEPWEQAYLDYLEEFDPNGYCTYSLIYVDEDEIPELVLDTGAEAGGCQILTWHEGVLDGLQTYRLNFSYVERGNLLCNSDGHMGYYYDNVYTIRDGYWEFLGGGAYHDPEGGPQLDDNGNMIFEYEWLEQPIEQSEYEQKLKAIYPENQEKKPERYYIKDEICSLFKTKKTISEKHRYELITADVTWTEAAKSCEEKGGYLATITSWEEFERVQELIVSEEKTAVTFFVGANRVSGLGYSWQEPGIRDGYDMLKFYNALFAGFWLDGEPSYESVLEDGTTIKEEYVSIFYRSADGRCYLNDVAEDILSSMPSYAGRIGYICEYNE